MHRAELDKLFLHRACIQLSSPLVGQAEVEAETRHALVFARAHAGQHAREIAQALVWRVVDTDDTDDEADRTGAWTVLTRVLAECGEAGSELGRTPLADSLTALLPALIHHRWLTFINRPATRPDGAAAPALDLAAYDRVVPAEKINDTRHKSLDQQTAFTLVQRYDELLATWERVLRGDVFKQLHRDAKAVRRGGNELKRGDASLLAVQESYRDSLWRLRRKSPRPALALHTLVAYGWDTTHRADDGDGTSGGPRRGRRLPASLTDVEALDPAMHPGVLRWLKIFVDAKGGCCLCDTWRHVEERCPCEAAFFGGAAAEGGQKRRRTNRRQLTTYAGRRFTYMEAVDVLYQSGVALPPRAEAVLDLITSLIRQEKPYEALLAAYDTVRGAVTGPEELHALWLHASYALLPSKTVFEKPSDSSDSPAVEKAIAHLHASRRIRESKRLVAAVETLDTAFRRRTLDARAAWLLHEIQETRSFFFCLLDGSLPATYTPGEYARVPKEVVGAARLKDVVCHACLEPFHAMERCPDRPPGCDDAEPWDLMVARVALEEYGLIDLAGTADPNNYRIHEAMKRIDEDDRQAKDFRKSELQLAVKLLVERRVAYCAECRVCGHSTRRCEARARRTFEREELREVDVRLDPTHLHRRIRELRLSGHTAAADELRDAYGVLAASSRGYPRDFDTAIREMRDAHIPLAAARYNTDAVQGFLLYISSSDLLVHLSALRSDDFPEVCLFCDSLHHRSEDCRDAKSSERGFLLELRRAGVSLWRYMRSPQYYDARLPTDYPSGRLSVVQLVRQFDAEYGPGGLARQKFIELNGLEGAAGLSQTAGMDFSLSQLNNATASSSGVLSNVAPLYSSGFSQVLRPAAAPAPVAAPLLEGLDDGRTHGADAFLGGIDFAVGRRPRDDDDDDGHAAEEPPTKVPRPEEAWASADSSGGSAASPAEGVAAS